MTHNPIIGRYAPSPTGSLHLGNLRTALLAWLQARLAGGRFLLRMEDLDQPRVVPGSADQILRDLEWLGLDWDGEVMYQSRRHDAYEDALRLLERQGLVYSCFCSRKDIQTALSAPHIKSSAYPGTCKNITPQEQARRKLVKNAAIRVKVPHGLQVDVGDFVIRRADNLFAYQLAVVVDDIHQGVNQVVRGADLLDSCSRQKYLIQLLGKTEQSVEYLHAPLMLDRNGNRLAKRDGSASIALWKAEKKSSEELIAYLFNSLEVGKVANSISLSDLLKTLNNNSFKGLWVN